MSEMVERVARAMASKESGPEGSQLFDVHWREFGQGYLSNARAAIEAMREPTEAMEQAGDSPGWDDSVTSGLSRQSWQAMIDEALK